MKAAEAAEAQRAKEKDEEERKRAEFQILEERRTHAELEREKKRNLEVKELVLEMKQEYNEMLLEKGDAKRRHGLKRNVNSIEIRIGTRKKKTTSSRLMRANEHWTASARQTS